MIEHTTSPALAPAALPPLVSALWRLLWAHRPAVRQGRCFERLPYVMVRQSFSAGILRLTWMRCSPRAHGFPAAHRGPACPAPRNTALLFRPCAECAWDQPAPARESHR